MRRMSHVSNVTQGSRRGSVVSIQRLELLSLVLLLLLINIMIIHILIFFARSVPASPLLNRTAPPSSLVEEEKQS